MDLWMEGFSFDGNSTPARLCGTFKAKDLKTAVHMYMDTLDTQCEKAKVNLMAKPPTYWGCKFFDNEDDARRTFG